MANTRELRRRIKSVKNTAQITKAMQMVAATKMRRAQMQATNGRPYAENLSVSLSRLLPKVEKVAHPLLNKNDSKAFAVVFLTTDKGLVGALNTNLMRTVLGLQDADWIFYTVGRKGRGFVVKTGKALKADFAAVDVITFRQAKQLARLLMDSFKAREFGEAYLIYPHFLSTLRQEPRRVKLLPIDFQSVIASPRSEVWQSSEPGNSNRFGKDDKSDFIFEPGPDALLDYLLLHYIEEQIYQALLETKASEHSARMMAMQNATDNAKELVEDLQLTYNQTRQANITTELLEITTAQVAMQ